MTAGRFDLLKVLASEDSGQDLTESALAMMLIALGGIVTFHNVAATIANDFTDLSVVVVTGQLPQHFLH